MKKLILGLLVSIVFIYFSFKGVEYEKTLKELQNIRYIFLLPAIILLLSSAFLRSFRWSIILSPMAKVPQKILFPVTCVGSMAIILIPMRVGELVRPYMLSKKTRISFTPALATVLAERVIDSFTLILILFLIMLKTPLPGWIVRTGYGFSAVFSIVFLLICFFYLNKKFNPQLLKRLNNILPHRFISKAEKIIGSFLNGLKIIESPVRLSYTFLLSFVMWGISGLAIYTFFSMVNLQLPLISAFFVLVITMMGISLPTAPGFIGNFQFACIFALSIFGVSKDSALAFSMLSYLIGIGLQILLGLVFLPFMKISFKDLRDEIRTKIS